MSMEKMVFISHNFKTSSRESLVRTLRQIADDSDLCKTNCRSKRQIARELGISESTWKRIRGVGGDVHKVDIYYLLKFITLYSNCHGIALMLPSHSQYLTTLNQQSQGNTKKRRLSIIGQ